ncbi:MAG TPA: twin-arginine translocation signal domain-containing protein [Acidobacteriota bacterium]|nr:twin-arginine translocation signal domain-containing protein [Acidobacteriota bacterium]HND17902.1 twin-arginine translocation signal domain-containing protein [Acidobacteriota bacterium]HNH85427.1 twin-arginine translocation signal domain-containing protein [Acidobacteriota bacterium]
MQNAKTTRRSVLKTLTALPLGGALLSLFGGTANAAVVDQPHMDAALDALQTAKRELDKATPDKGGHRNRAQNLVDKAIAEVQKGIRYDRRN